MIDEGISRASQTNLSAFSFPTSSFPSNSISFGDYHVFMALRILIILRTPRTSPSSVNIYGQVTMMVIFFALSPNISSTFSYFWPAKYECIMINDRYGNFRPQTEYSILQRPQAKRAWLFKLEPRFILMYSSSICIWWLNREKSGKALEHICQNAQTFLSKNEGWGGVNSRAVWNIPKKSSAFQSFSYQPICSFSQIDWFLDALASLDFTLVRNWVVVSNLK